MPVTPGSHFASRSRSFGFGIVAGVAPVPVGTRAQLEVAILLAALDGSSFVELRIKSMETSPS